MQTNSYKQDTSKLATWLVATAQSIRTPSRAASGRTDRKSTARLVLVSRAAKRKERKDVVDACEQQKPPLSMVPTPSNSSDPTRVVLQTSQFTVPVKKIADAAVSVPPAVIKWTMRAIRERRVCADWFLRLDTGDTPTAHADDNAKHRHFISVLEQVVDILLPHCTVRKRGPGQTTCTKLGNDSLLSNQFAALSPVGKGDHAHVFDDETDESMVCATAASSAPHAPTRPSVTYEAEADAMDTLVAIQDAFDDFAAIRQFMRDSWSKVCNGELEAITASLITNTAVDHAHDTSIKLATMDPSLADPHKACRLAARENGDPEPVWPDMDAFIGLYGRDNCFYGRAPDSAEAAKRSFNIMKGMSISTPLWDYAQRPGTYSAFKIKRATALTSNSSRAEALGLPAGRARWHPMHQLAHKRELVQSEQDLICSDCLGLHALCVGVLLGLADCVRDKLFAQFGINGHDLVHDYDLTFVVKKIIEDWWCSDTVRHGGLGRTSLGMIHDATQYLREWVKEHGARGADVAAAEESGHAGEC
ncbi:hypothetical protein GGF32_006434 [Allomyces javanicus]|nr:hypothetical protein GGF32_006434 [Allomyces javanicus]